MQHAQLMPIISIGQAVRCKVFNGGTQTGHIAGIMHSDPFLFSLRWAKKDENYNLIEWDTQFPAWRQNFVYYVYLDQPSKGLTFEEFKKSYQNMELEELTDFELKEKYEELPLAVMSAHPRESLELLVAIEDIFNQDIQ